MICRRFWKVSRVHEKVTAALQAADGAVCQVRAALVGSRMVWYDNHQIVIAVNRGIAASHWSRRGMAQQVAVGPVPRP